MLQLDGFLNEALNLECYIHDSSTSHEISVMVVDIATVVQKFCEHIPHLVSGPAAFLRPRKNGKNTCTSGRFHRVFVPSAWILAEPM